MNLININDYKLQVKELNGQRVVTFEDIDTLHNRPDGTASRNFVKHSKRFISEKHFFKLSFDEVRSTNFVERPNSQGLVLITEKGYLLLVKSFNDDLAWQVQEQLIDYYFRAKELIKQQKSNPQWQEIRQQSKASRLRETDELERYVEYCKSHGSRNADNYYVLYTNMVNNAVGLEKGQRGIATADVLQVISILESTIQRTIADELNKGTEYHSIYRICKDKVSGIARLVYLPEQKLLPVIL